LPLESDSSISFDVSFLSVQSDALPHQIWVCFDCRSIPISGWRQEQEKEDAVKKIALAASLALALCGHAQARLVEIAAERSPIDFPRHSGLVTADVAAVQPREVVVLQSSTSDLAEPEVFAMMLLGLCLIGYRASRDSSEKFR
jgi:hypothetical protein